MNLVSINFPAEYRAFRNKAFLRRSCNCKIEYDDDGNWLENNVSECEIPFVTGPVVCKSRYPNPLDYGYGAKRWKRKRRRNFESLKSSIIKTAVEIPLETLRISM